MIKKIFGLLNSIRKIGFTKNKSPRPSRRRYNDVRYITLSDNRNHKYSGKLVDLSDGGCKIVFSGTRLFEGSELTIDWNGLDESRAKQNIKSKVIWASNFKVDYSRYCIVGINF